MSNSDVIGFLPLNSEQKPTQQDMRIMDVVFGAGNAPSSSNSVTKLLIPAGLFLVLSLPFVDRFIKGHITASDMVILGIKFGIFIAILLVFKMFDLA
jgi:hypothetical protein